MNKKLLIGIIGGVVVVITVVFLLFNPFSKKSDPASTQTPVANEEGVYTETEKPAEEKQPGSAQKSSSADNFGDSYVVKEGDTLGDIALKIYGDSKYWYKIFAANESEIDDWNFIYPGRKLKLPTQ